MVHTASTKAEISRQLDLIRGERWGRISLSVIAFALTAIYLPVWLALTCGVLNVTADLLGMRYMRALDPRRHQLRYRFVKVCVFFREFFITLPPALIWLQDENYAKAFAVGVASSVLLQLAMARAIFMPFGYAGIAGVALPILVSNTYFWMEKGDWGGFTISTVAALAAISYTIIAMHSNNRLHRNSARDRASALEGDKAKSRFLAQMSHELRTPLNAILGMGHAELRRNKDALSQKRLSVLIASAEGLSTILDDILDLSAVQAGRLPIRPIPAIPRDEILAMLGLFQPGIDAAGLHLGTDISPELSRIAMLDTQRLRQCLSNLMSNALKHTEKGEICVSARTVPAPSGLSTLLRIEVRDTGPGIPDALHRAVFEPFGATRDFDNTRGPAQESNGLGLSICRAMARQMGGDLILEPNLPDTEKGACFVLTLKLAAAPAGAIANRPLYRDPPPELEKPTEVGADEKPTAGLRVLVVDDIATNRLVATTYLRMLGARTIEAVSGDEALTCIATDLPDLVLLDMNMPGMSGMETLQAIRALPGEAGRLPVIALTADATDEHRRLYLESGLDGYLAKPINPTRIKAEIGSVLDKLKAPKAK